MVAIDLGGLFVRELENRRYAFDQALKLDDGLYSHEYHCAWVALPRTEEGTLSNPSGLVALASRLKVPDNPNVTFGLPEIPFLVVVEDGFFVEFDAEDSWGNTISYFTDRFSMDDVRKVLDA